MTKKEFEKTVIDAFGISPDYPFDEDFETAVFRHTDTKKWFAIMMKIPKARLFFASDGCNDLKCKSAGDKPPPYGCDETIWVVNLKCDPEIIESLAGVERGIFRAYHMNKSHWLTASLDMCDEDMIVWLVEKSYKLTKKVKK